VTALDHVRHRTRVVVFVRARYSFRTPRCSGRVENQREITLAWRLGEGGGGGRGGPTSPHGTPPPPAVPPPQYVVEGHRSGRWCVADEPETGQGAARGFAHRAGRRVCEPRDAR